MSVFSRPFRLSPLVVALSAATSFHATQALAQADQAPALETVVVTGKRVSQADIAIGMDSTSNTVAVTREELLSAPAGISGLKMLERLPGFNVQTDGALGLYEFGNSVNVRAFDLQQIGFVLDGVPMGRSDPFGGSPIFRYVDNENLSSVIASPGAGDVTKPSYASLGPMVSYRTVDPSDEWRVHLAYSTGDFDFRRSFVKLETGDLNGFRAYIARSKTDSDLWRGPGSIDREHIEAKAVYDVSDSTSLQFTYVSNDFFDYDSPSAPASVFEANYDFGYSATLPEGCQVADPQVFDFNGDGAIDDNDFTPLNTQSVCTRYFEDRINIRDDELFSLSLSSMISDALSIDATYYYEDKDGFGVSPDSYGFSRSVFLAQQSAGLDVVHPRGVQYGLSEVGGSRSGATLNLSWQLANHQLEFGGWVEADEYQRTQQRLNHEGGDVDQPVLFDEVVYFRRDYETTRDTVQLYLRDTISLFDDRLNLSLGIKSLAVDYELSGYRDYADYSIDGAPGYGPQTVGADYQDHFLPNIGATWTLDDNSQLFASYAENYALPKGADDIFDNAVGFTPEPPEGEQAQNFEIGYRTSRSNFNASVALFYTVFDNRLVASSVLNPATEQPEAFFINAGETTSRGLELSGVYQPELFDRSVYFTVNYTYNDSELKDGFGANPAGSTLAQTPEHLFTGGITWEPTNWLVANLSAKYTSKRYTDFAETFELESYTVASAYIDIGGPNDLGIPESLRLRLNLDNLTDEEVLSFAFTGTPFYRPLNPRTFQATLTYAF